MATEGIPEPSAPLINRALTDSFTVTSLSTLLLNAFALKHKQQQRPEGTPAAAATTADDEPSTSTATSPTENDMLQILSQPSLVGFAFAYSFRHVLAP